MSTLLIRHLENSDPPRFQVIRAADVKATEAALVSDPLRLPLPERPDTLLGVELRWYLEEFLDYPFPPQTERAEAVQAALQGWGEQAFTALFGSGLGWDVYSDAAREGLENLHLHIASDDPGILAWPWEALHDPQVGPLAHLCRIERRLDQLRDPLPLAEGLPHDCIHILLLTARPYEGDVRYRSLSRPLVELIKKQHLPAQVTVLWPPTFDTLRAHLRERPAYYHIVHFDGHGGYGSAEGGGSAHLFRGYQGRLIFETEEGQPEAVTAEQLSALLREYRIPVMESIPKRLVQAARDKVGKKASFFNNSHRPAL
jgi:hypothetical protein